MKRAIVTKYVGGKVVSTTKVVKHKGVYMDEGQVPCRPRNNIRQAFFRDALSKMSDAQANKALGFLRSI